MSDVLLTAREPETCARPDHDHGQLVVRHERPYMRLYISGPITGMPDLNTSAFTAAEAALLDRGYEVVNPRTIPLVLDGDWHYYLREALKLMLTCDALAMLPGWEKSRGAGIEFRLAADLNMVARELRHWCE